MSTFALTRSPVRRVGGAVLIVVALVWLRVNGPYEGRVLLVVNARHGLTEADLASFAAVGVAAMLLLSRRGTSDRAAPRGGRDRARR